MARRMFSPQIVSSDAFLDMPISSQALYFHLNMNADDDGFVGNPKKILRIIGGTDDDIKLLLAKRFILGFADGVIVVKHWLIHNLIRADLYKETLYKKHKLTLGLNENGAYTELRDGISPIKVIEAPKWLKIRRGELRTANVPLSGCKDRIGKDRIDIPASQDSLKVNNTKTMKKNSFGKYREDMPTDSYETVIDADTGEEEKYKPKGSNAKLMTELIEWATKRRGGNFVNLGKQYKAISNLKQAKISPDAIKSRWVELESDDYYKLHGLDFMSVASSFDKKPL